LSEEINFLLRSLLIIAALFLLYRLLVRYNLITNGRSGKYVEIVEKAPITAESGIVVLKVGKKKFLASYSKEGVRLLKEIEDEESTPPSDSPSDRSKG
jgi:flagellar biogenesis protein FliO